MNFLALFRRYEFLIVDSPLSMYTKYYPHQVNGTKMVLRSKYGVKIVVTEVRYNHIMHIAAGLAGLKCV